MSKKPNKTTAVSTTVKAQLAKFAIDTERKNKEIEQLTVENKALRKQNVELASVIENDLKADLKVQIIARSNYTDSDLETLTIEQLQQINQTLSMGKGDGAVYKSIRAGGASEQKGHTTVGSLYGLTREQILAKKGDF